MAGGNDKKTQSKEPVVLNAETQLQGEPVALGQGGYAKVSKIRFSEANVIGLEDKDYALKIETEKKTQSATSIEHEYEIHSQLAHPNVVDLEGVVEQEGRVVGLLLGVMDKPLSKAIENEPETLSLSRIGLWFDGLVDAIDYLRENKVTHSDIKGDNILIQGDAAKLADFGISTKNESFPLPSVSDSSDFAALGQTLGDVIHAKQKHENENTKNSTSAASLFHGEKNDGNTIENIAEKKEYRIKDLLAPKEVEIEESKSFSVDDESEDDNADLDFLDEIEFDFGDESYTRRKV